MGFASLDESDLASLPAGLEELVRSDLAPGEKLLWVGRPRASRIILSYLPISVVGVFVAAFAVFWVAIAMNAPMGFALFGLPIVAIGLGMIVSPFWGAYAASRTCYAVTNQRAITWEPVPWAGLQVRSFAPAELASIARNQRGDGSGDLIFHELVTYGPKGRRNVTRQGFFGIERVREVESLIRTHLTAR